MTYSILSGPTVTERPVISGQEMRPKNTFVNAESKGNALKLKEEKNALVILQRLDYLMQVNN